MKAKRKKRKRERKSKRNGEKEKKGREEKTCERQKQRERERERERGGQTNRGRNGLIFQVLYINICYQYINNTHILYLDIESKKKTTTASTGFCF